MTDNEMKRMQEEALRRTQEMQRRAAAVRFDANESQNAARDTHRIAVPAVSGSMNPTANNNMNGSMNPPANNSMSGSLNPPVNNSMSGSMNSPVNNNMSGSMNPPTNNSMSGSMYAASDNSTNGSYAGADNTSNGSVFTAANNTPRHGAQPDERAVQQDAPSQERSQPPFRFHEPTAGIMNGGIFETLFKDKEKTLILALMLLLMDEQTDNALLMALMYLLI